MGLGRRTRKENVVAKRSLVIVESPTKVKTIQKYLDSSFVVKASMGHVRDLPKSQLGVDPKKGFKPKYVVSPGKKKVLDELKKAAANADTLYVATDPDREGEAIGWHLAQELDVGKNNVYRVSFNEITERAVRGAFAKPGRIDLKKVDAQQARRVLDRLVGYKLSPLLWDKVQRGLSAGRVQSVAVRLIVDREREIQAFVPVEYWSLHARLAAKLPPEFVATLKEVDGEKVSLADGDATRALMASLQDARFVVKSVTRGERRRNPVPPFITSTLQQEAGRKLGFTAKKTMAVAQQLYEGIDLGAEGAKGLITYMRTDSVRVAREAQAEAREWITARLGLDYVPDAPPAYRSRGSHEDDARPAEEDPESAVPQLDEGEVLRLLALDPRQHFTQPPPHYTEASLIKTLEELGIGRPSTYASILGTIINERAYVRRERKALIPTELGIEVTNFLKPFFPEIMDVEFTAQMEDSLDKIEEGDRKWVDTVQEFYAQFEKDLKKASKEGRNVKVGAPTGEQCPECGKGLVERWSRYGKFIACSAYPECKYKRNLPGNERAEDQPTDELCPACGKPMVIKHGRFGKFIACSGYPECKTTKPVTLGIACPQPGCAGQLVERRSRRGRVFFGCSAYPNCTFVVWQRPVMEPCPKCGAPFTTERAARGRVLRRCVREGCDFEREVEISVA